MGSAFAAFAALALRIGGAFANHDWLFVAFASTGILAFAFTGFALMRLCNAIRREGVDTLRSVLGLATAPPVWITLNKTTDLIWVDHGDIDTTNFQMRGIDLDTVLHDTHDDCKRQIESLITDGRSVALSNRAMVQEMDQQQNLPRYPSVSRLPQVPTHVSGLGPTGGEPGAE